MDGKPLHVVRLEKPLPQNKAIHSFSSEAEAKSEQERLLRSHGIVTYLDAPGPVGPGIRTLLTVEEGYLGLAFGDPSTFQGLHKGWDIWPESQSARARLFAPLPGKIIEVRDYGSVSGFTQALQVRYDNGIVQQSGHLKAGISKRWKVGMRFEAGQELAEIGTASDGKGIRHAHIEIFLDEGAALRYDHSRAKDPANYRDDFGETGPVPRVMGFASEVAAGADEEMLAAGLSLVDVPCGC